jgi:hypothetical protein
MPSWLLQVLLDELAKLLSPELIKKFEDAAKQFAYCELKKLVATTPTTIDDQVLAAIAAALGVDTTKCPA